MERDRKVDIRTPSFIEQKSLLKGFNLLVKALSGLDTKPYWVFNKDFVPNNTNFILAVNHDGIMGVPALLEVMLGLSKERKKDMWVHFIAREQTFSHAVIGKVIERAGMIPIDRENPGHSTIRIALSLLENGRNVGIMPEGTRSKELGEFHNGVTLLSVKSGKPILPVAIKGSGSILTGAGTNTFSEAIPDIIKYRLGKEIRPKISIAFSEPINPSDYKGDVDTKRQRIEITAEVRRRISEKYEVLKNT